MDIPISLYLKTEKDTHPDLKVVAQAAITFAEIIQSIAYSIDPEMEVRVEIVSGSEGSLGLNTLSVISDRISKTAQGVLKGWRKEKRLRFLMIYVALKILDNSVSWSMDKIMDWLSGPDAPEEVRQMKPDEIKALAKDLAEELRKEEIHTEVSRLHSQLRKDTRIEAIGVTAKPGPAKFLLPRSEFLGTQDGPDKQDQVVRRRYEARLISPVLEFGDRRWKLRGPLGEFGAPIMDRSFLRKVVSGETNLHLQGGVILDVSVDYNERKEDGVWVVVSQSVAEVHGWREGPAQEDLLPPSP